LRPTVEVQVEIDFAESNSHVMNNRNWDQLLRFK